MARCRRAKFWAGVGFALRDTAWNRIAAMREPDTVAVERRRIDNLSARRIPLLQNDGYLCTFLQEAEKEVVGRVPTRGVSSMFFGGLQYVAVKRHNWRIDFMAKMTIPDELKADIPPTAWGKVLTATPIIMTVIATALAGLASSEMTRAQYSRSLAAQQQSKAGDQWGFFQAKRLRGAIQRNSIDILQNTTDVHPLDAAVLDKAGSTLLQSPAGQQAVAALLKGEMPGVPAGPVLEGELQAAVELVEKEGPDARVRLTDKQMAEALDAAKERARLFDATMQPINQVIDTIEKALAGVGDKSLNRDFVAARLRYTATRYDTEARLNQAIGNLYELQVRKSNIDAERHHKRSQQFFYGMLGAQMAVIIATFAIAARKRNLLWSLAAAAGAAAVGFAVYVFLYM